MTRGTLRCVTCGQAGHVSASCPQGRSWWQRLRDRIIVPDPFDVSSAFEDSQPRSSLSAFMDSQPPTAPPDDDPTVPGGLDTKPGDLR